LIGSFLLKHRVKDGHSPAAARAETACGASQGPQQAHSQPAGLSQETRDLLDFVRTENAANREYFNFLLRIAGSLFGALLALAAGVVVFFGWRTIDDPKNKPALQRMLKSAKCKNRFIRNYNSASTKSFKRTKCRN
jgi:hypothetical protein